MWRWFKVDYIIYSFREKLRGYIVFFKKKIVFDFGYLCKSGVNWVK